MRAYTTITGRRYDLDALTSKEREFLEELMKRHRARPSWAEFAGLWQPLARKSIWKGKRVPVGAPLWRICQDLEFRLGLAQGGIAPVNYRDRLADLIEARFRSRYEFCKKTGIDQGHLSRVLHSEKHFAPETLFKVLEALEVELDLVSREEIHERASRALEPESFLDRLHEVQRRLDRLLRVKKSPRAKKLDWLASARLSGDELVDRMRKRVEAGERFATVLDDELRAALAEKALLAKALAKEAVEAEKAHRRAAS